MRIYKRLKSHWVCESHNVISSLQSHEFDYRNSYDGSNVVFCALQVEKSGETPEKEQIELKEEEVSEKKDDSTEKTKKAKKEKKPKEPKPPKAPKGPNCIDLISKDLDLANRDSNNVNVEINVSTQLIFFIRGRSQTTFTRRGR